MFEHTSNFETTDRFRQRKRGFTMVELLVAISITVTLAAVSMAFYTTFAKATLSISSYSNFELDAGKLMQHFSNDVRGAENVIWTSPTEFQLLKKGIYITYTYDSLLQTVTRSKPGETAQVISKEAVILQFAAYDVSGNRITIGNNLSAANSNTKMMQIIGSYDTVTNAGLRTSAPIVSARYVLRNKPTPLP